ncbi:hypothetical protein GTA08_BOTSDO04086 [Neofusicoccum parvum]|uniref:Uncharacterized protein n=1 Tax=Neofusicoccum parvum TaxID=310453 RepID=A0ACB5S616_9PEZI|nr:hypothetical protein GTA08_BOTSDO04086 [Neofusicoccum parvum]
MSTSTTAVLNNTTSMIPFSQAPPCPYTIITVTSNMTVTRHASTSLKAPYTNSTSSPPTTPITSAKPPGAGIDGPNSDNDAPSSEAPSPHSTFTPSITVPPSPSSNSPTAPAASASHPYTPSFAPYPTYTTPWRPASPVAATDTADYRVRQASITTIVGAVCGVVTFVLALGALGEWWVHRRGVRKEWKVRREGLGSGGVGEGRRGPFVNGAVRVSGSDGGRERAVER